MRDCLQLIDEKVPVASSLRQLCDMGARTQKHTDRGVHIYRRLMGNNYKDGVHKFPASAMGGDMPNPRKIAETLFLQSSGLQREDKTRSIAVAQWAQFIEQDLARTVQSTMKDGTPIECCNQFNRVRL